MAYKWARIRAVSASDKRLGIDPKTVKQNVMDIESSINCMGNIKRQCKNITQSTEIIEKKIVDEEHVIKGKIAYIIQSMDGINPSPEQ